MVEDLGFDLAINLINWFVTPIIDVCVHYKQCTKIYSICHGPLTRYIKFQIAHAPWMSGTFSPTSDFCVFFNGNRQLAIPACITARAWRTCHDACRDRLPPVVGKTFPAFPAHAHPQFCVSGKRPMNYMHRSWFVMLCRILELFDVTHVLPDHFSGNGAFIQFSVVWWVINAS